MARPTNLARLITEMTLAKDIFVMDHGTDRFEVRFKQGDWEGPVFKLFDWRQHAKDMADELNAPIRQYGLERDGIFVVVDRGWSVIEGGM